MADITANNSFTVACMLGLTSRTWNKHLLLCKQGRLKKSSASFKTILEYPITKRCKCQGSITVTVSPIDLWCFSSLNLRWYGILLLLLETMELHHVRVFQVQCCWSLASIQIELFFLLLLFPEFDYSVSSQQGSRFCSLSGDSSDREVMGACNSRMIIRVNQKRRRVARSWMCCSWTSWWGLNLVQFCQED